MKYNARPAPATLPELSEFVSSEFRSLAQILKELEPMTLTLDELHAEPSRRYTGLTVLADGTDWNPGGTGAGVYTFYGAAWHKLG